MFRLKTSQGRGSLLLRIKKLPIVLMQKSQQTSATPSRVPAAKQQVCGVINSSQAAKRMPPRMPKERPVATKTFVSAISRHHDFAVLACCPAHGERRKH